MSNGLTDVGIYITGLIAALPHLSHSISPRRARSGIALGIRDFTSYIAGQCPQLLRQSGFQNRVIMASYCKQFTDTRY